MAITNKDIEKLSDVFITKKELQKSLAKLSGIFATKYELQDGLSSLKAELTNQILTSEDKILKKVEDVLIEQRMAYAQPRRHEERLENHEQRIHALEVKV